MPSQYRFDDVEIDLSGYRVLKAGRVLAIEPKAFSVLIFLVRNQGRMVSKRELLDAIWNDAFVTENVLTRAIAQLRKALEDGVKEGRYIETVPTQGYRFIADVREDNPAQTPPVAQVRQSHAVMWGGLGAIVILAAGIAAWNLKPRVVDRPMSPPMPLTTFQGSEAQPTFSPDGNQVAFSWDGEKEDNRDIYAKAIGSETPLRLTSDPAQDVSPAWSPDGRMIAFVRLKGTDKFDLMLIPALGGPERKLAEFGSPAAGTPSGLLLPAWSADSKWLVVPVALPDRFEVPLFKVSVESGEAGQITKPEGSLADAAPQISQDGKTLLFTRRHLLARGDLFAVELDGSANPVGQPHKISLGLLQAGTGSWTASGSEILVRNTLEGVYRVPASGSKSPERIPWLGLGTGPIAISRDGRRMAYSVVRGDANLRRVDLTAKQARPERFIASTFRDAYPEYSPDGTRIAFYSNRGGSSQIWMCNADGGQAHQLTFVETRIAGTPHWSPDGKTLSFDSNVTGEYQVYTMSPEGGKITQMTQGPSFNFAATWSRDGQSIYFSSSRSGRNEIWKMPASGGAPVQITHNGGVKAIESFDGQTIYFGKEGGGGSIWEMPAKGGPEKQLAASLYRSNFALTRRGIYYMTNTDEDSTIKLNNFADGNTITIAPMGRPEFGLDVSPDGRYLIYAQLDDAGSDLMLVENFH